MNLKWKTVLKIIITNLWNRSIKIQNNEFYYLIDYHLNNNKLRISLNARYCKTTNAFIIINRYFQFNDKHNKYATKKCTALRKVTNSQRFSQSPWPI